MSADKERIPPLSEIARAQFDTAAELVGLNDAMRLRLSTPSREISVQIPVLMDDGRTEIFFGHRVQHNSSRGPSKGGIRYHQSVTLEEVRGLAALMTWKTSLLNIPFGGGKGGVAVDASKLSITEKERLTRRYTRQIAPIIGDHKDIPAPDVGTDAQTMAWLFDEYSAQVGQSPAVVTGKPLSLGGSLGREEATGRGVMLVMRAHAQAEGLPWQGATAVIQGFGNVGSHLARCLHEEGVRVIAIADVNGAIYNADGIDIPSLLQWTKSTCTVVDAPGTEKIDAQAIWQIPCDYLVPAALESVINRSNAGTLPCKVLVEAANGPTTPMGEAILADRGITILPDFLANGGGVLVSYYEWTQNLQQFRWTLKDVQSRTEVAMQEAYDAVRAEAERRRIDFRQAAYAIAIQRVAETEALRGC